MCNFSGLPSETPTFLTPDPLPRFTNTECEDHKCTSNIMSTHHQLFVTEGSTVITKKKPLVTCYRFYKTSVGNFSGSDPTTPRGTPQKKEETLYCTKLRQFHINFH